MRDNAATLIDNKSTDEIVLMFNQYCERYDNYPSEEEERGETDDGLSDPEHDRTIDSPEQIAQFLEENQEDLDDKSIGGKS